eukprot:TRINITY_DN2767_c0_g1_i1.p2 TRINITY_DN2767_c0_g1~~TRINITY_DN2767_c0_g1_i1.p2  ORF type:complete len:398 (+),score=71.86 TRINITY_DN2767_c0_g1_i1:86-1195(+)
MWRTPVFAVVLCSAVGPSLASIVQQLPRLSIDPRGITTNGHSSGGDMAVQFHVAFSAHISGVCGFDAQPYACAATRFAGDALVPQSDESSVPNCKGCPAGQTLVYDHCKNHPEWVDVGKLPDYPRRTCGNGGLPGCIDDVTNLYNTSVYLTRGECRTYVGGAEVNTFAMYAQMTLEPQRQIKYTDTCLPNGTHLPIDTELECLRHVYSGVELAPPRSSAAPFPLEMFDQTPFIDDSSVGIAKDGWIYIPSSCRQNATNATACRLMVFFHGCGGCHIPELSATHARYAAYAESNKLVMMHPCIQNKNNVSLKHKNAYEIARGCWDGYGQLGTDYALQSAPHMRAVWNMVRHVAALDDAPKARTDCAKQCG